MLCDDDSNNGICVDDDHDDDNENDEGVSVCNVITGHYYSGG